MTGTLRAAAIVGAMTAGITLLASACSSVPDVQFGDGGGSTSSGGSSGGSSGSSSGTPEPPDPDWDCAAGKPPPAGEGVCCGSKLCLRCSESDCSRCEQSGCAGTLSATCCKNKGNGNIQCKSHDGC